jgi:hypothetical protein
MQDFKEITQVDLTSPVGWVVIPLKIKNSEGNLDYFTAMNFRIKIK